MQECWRTNIPKIWEERHTPLPEGAVPADLIRVPDNAHLFAAIGAVEFGKSEEAHVGAYRGWADLEDYIERGRNEGLSGKEERSLGGPKEELAAFKSDYRRKAFVPAAFPAGQVIEGFVGLEWRVHFD
jgi:hypothetical protein